MAANVEIKLNLLGLNELMKSPEIESALREAGEAVASKASAVSEGAEYGVRTATARWISVANVYPNSEDAAKANYEDNTLLKAAGEVGLKMSKGG